MQIKYTDDKKGRYQSVKAEATFSCITNMGYIKIDMEGLGSSEEDAKDELMHVLKDALYWLDSRV